MSSNLHTLNKMYTVLKYSLYIFNENSSALRNIQNVWNDKNVFITVA